MKNLGSIGCLLGSIEGSASSGVFSGFSSRFTSEVGKEQRCLGDKEGVGGVSHGSLGSKQPEEGNRGRMGVESMHRAS